MPDADLIPNSKPPASIPESAPRDPSDPAVNPDLNLEPENQSQHETVAATARDAAPETSAAPEFDTETAPDAALEAVAAPGTDALLEAADFPESASAPALEAESEAALEAAFYAELEADLESEYAPFDAAQFAATEPAASAPNEEDEPSPEAERVSKLIAKAGLASRRAAEEMIAAGRVTLNGHVISEQGTKADLLNDRIVVDGHPLRITEKPGVVLVFHKPRLVMTTRDDPGGRSTVMDFLPRKWQSLHPVGRLDFDTSGVLLLTDDGELTHLLTHPSHGAEKVYEARVRGVVEPAAIEKLERGVRLDDGPTAPCRAKLMAQRDKNALIQLVLREGRNRQVRRMLDAVGHPAGVLRRISFAGVELEGLPAGEFRVLLPGEVKALRRRVESKVKKLSEPKGKFHPRKIPALDPKKPAEPEVVPFKTAHKRLERVAIARQEPEEKRSLRPSPRNSTKPAPAPKSGTKPDSRPAPRRPRNAPDAPPAPKLERKGSKARALSDAQSAQKPSPRAPKTSAPRSQGAPSSAPRGPNAPRTSAPRSPGTSQAPRDSQSSGAARPQTAPRSSPPRPQDGPRASKAPREEKPADAAKTPRPRRAPVADRVEKRWKS